MKNFILISFAALSFTALADIPRPPVSGSVVEVTLGSQDAVELYDSLQVQVLRGSNLRTGFSTYKVFRAESGLTQIVCEKYVSRVFNQEPVDAKTNGTCKIQKSTDGKKLPTFKPVIRMG